MIFKYNSLAALAAGVVVMMPALVSCDNIDENDRFLPNPRPVVEKTVLVAEFTGMNCVNCPTGAETIHNVQLAYPGDVIAVGLHPENNVNTRPIPGLDQDFQSHEATVFYEYDKFKTAYFPAAIIDGAAPNSNINEWSSLIISQLSNTSPVVINVDADFDKSSRKLVVNYDVKFNEVYMNRCSILLWVMENNIVGIQQTPTGYVTDYVHNHVLRASVNGDWGVELGAYFEPEMTVSGSAEMTLPEKWVAENCQVVAFVFQSDSKTVEQAALTEAVKADDPSK